MSRLKLEFLKLFFIELPSLLKKKVLKFVIIEKGRLIEFGNSNCGFDIRFELSTD